MNVQSLRWRLPLTYAGIALITAVAMGAVLLVTLRGFYNDQERAYLQKNAAAIRSAITPLLKGGQAPAELGDHILLLAFLSQTRVQLIDADNHLVIDSGVPGKHSALTIAAMSLPWPGPGPNPDGPLVDNVYERKALEGPEDGWQSTFFGFSILGSGPDAGLSLKKQVFVTSTGSQNTLRIFYNGKDPGAKADLPPGIQGEAGLVSVIPVVGTMYGFNLQPGASQGSARSAQSVSETISADGKVWGTLEISDGPAIGSEIVAGVARVGAVAAGIAVAIAAALGWWISQRMSAPLVALTGSTRRMAAGDLSVRAEVSGQDEFGALARSFNDMAVQVEKMVGSLRRFASDAAHELQTPLTALHTNLELARQDQPANSALEQAWAQVARLEALCSDLLDLSRIEANPPEEPGSRVEISALLRETCEPYASEAEQTGRSFHLDRPESEVFVCANAGHLRRALANLFENALKFTPAGGSVKAGLQVEANVARIWVEDTGIGIPPEDLPFIFQRFHRARNASPYPGSGLGLAIVQAIVQRYGGQVRVEALAPGTRFEIQFSVAD